MTQHRSELLKLAAEMVIGRGMPSPYSEDWHLPKTVPKKVMRQIRTAAEQADNQCKDWAVRLRKIVDSEP